MGFSTVLFGVLCSQGGTLLVFLLCELARVFPGLLATLLFRFCIAIADLFILSYNYIFAYDCFWLDWDVVLGNLSISPLYCSYLGNYLPPICRPLWLRALYYWYGFYPGLALLYEPYGIGDCKGLYAPTGPLLAYQYGTQHWDAIQYTHTIMPTEEQYMF